MPSLHAVNMKILNYTPSPKVYGYCFGIYTPSVSLCSDPLHPSSIANLPWEILWLFSHRCNHTAWLSLTLALNRKANNSECYSHTLKYRYMNSIVFIDYSSFFDNCSQLRSFSTFGNEELTLHLFFLRIIYHKIKFIWRTLNSSELFPLLWFVCEIMCLLNHLWQFLICSTNCIYFEFSMKSSSLNSVIYCIIFIWAFHHLPSVLYIFKW